MLETLLARAVAGELTSIAFLAETASNRLPHIEIVGRWRSDPVRLVGELVIAKERVAAMAIRQRYG